MSKLITIDLAALSTVFGGADDDVSVGGKVDPRTVELNARRSRKQSERNQCITNNIKRLCPTRGTFSREVADPDACVARMNDFCGTPGDGQN